MWTCQCNCAHPRGSSIGSRVRKRALFSVRMPAVQPGASHRSVPAWVEAAHRGRSPSAATRRVVDVRRVPTFRASDGVGPHAAAAGPRVRLRRPRRVAPARQTAAFRRLLSRRRNRGARPRGRRRRDRAERLRGRTRGADGYSGRPRVRRRFGHRALRRPRRSPGSFERPTSGGRRPIAGAGRSSGGVFIPRARTAERPEGVGLPSPRRPPHRCVAPGAVPRVAVTLGRPPSAPRSSHGGRPTRDAGVKAGSGRLRRGFRPHRARLSPARGSRYSEP